MTIFRDQQLQEQFDSLGFVTIPFANAAEIAHLSAFFNSLQAQQLPGFHASMYHTDLDYRRKVDVEISSFVSDKLDGALNGYEVLYSNFMVKEPGQESAFFLHQDWSYVDEPEHTSLAIWFPLMDLAEENGPLQIWPGSHRISNHIRGFGSPVPFGSNQDGILQNEMLTVNLRAGEALLWHHKLFHYSGANISDKKRIAATSILVPRGAEVFHHFVDMNNPEAGCERFKADNHFFVDYQLGKRPTHGQSLGFVDVPKVKEDYPEFSAAIKRAINR